MPDLPTSPLVPQSSKPPSPSALKAGCGEWGFRNLPMHLHFEIAAEFGFKELEFGIGGAQPGRLSEDPTPAEIRGFRTLGADWGIATPGCCIENDFTLADAALHAAQVQKALAQSRAAALCGAKQVRFFAGFTPVSEMTEPQWSRLLSALLKCDAELETLGLTMAIETHGAIRFQPDGSAIHLHTATTDRSALSRLLSELPERIGFNYDPGNVRAADPADTRYGVDLLAGRITYCHLKDWLRSGEGWVACAVGDARDGIDFKALLPKTNYHGTFLIEYEPLADTREGIARSLAHLRSEGFALTF
jgi:sugar phosphate isomerase/epimerase